MKVCQNMMNYDLPVARVINSVSGLIQSWESIFHANSEAGAFYVYTKTLGVSDKIQTLL